ncbi:MAG TPA: vanadium-dependent haloperoxidase [Saprospiraceae bacterium]|nr:vanadium-dependent haloperoxidase [Saprospiraceae bacterium]
MRSIVTILALSALLLQACQPANSDYQQQAANPEHYHRSMKQLTDVIVHDIFSPPVAARIYSYANAAGYEAAHAGKLSLANRLNGLNGTPQPQPGQEYCLPLASVQAFLTVGKALIFSEEKMDSFQNQILAEYKKMGIPTQVYNRSVQYGDEVAKHILAWAATDNYKQSRTFPKYSISPDPAVWQPTPPSYMDGIEPHWNTIRTFLLDSAAQFAPPPPTPFDLTPGSPFHKELMEVYQALDAPDRPEREAIAQFWDCNPYKTNQVGHVMFATKKITPGGHWMNIAGLAARKAGSDFEQTTRAYAFTAVTLHDAFVSCWDEKYRSKLVRPETVINRSLDENWLPLLQTPPFPEYTSGHSVASSSAAVVLTALFGDNFAFDDDTENEYGLPTRSFRSFAHAADEASMSRMYGGIHYRPAIINGVEQGGQIGKLAVSKLPLSAQTGMK